jgi:hypothetical protein
MKYLIFKTEQDALNRSQEICISQGCTGNTTTYWFGVIKHRITEEGAMQIPEGQESILTEQEISELKDQTYMQDNGWFPDQPIY